MGSHWMLTGYEPTIEINDNLNPSVRLGRRARCAGPTTRGCRPTSACPSPPPQRNAAYLGRRLQPVRPGQRPEQPELPGAQPEAARPRVDLDRLPRPPRAARTASTRIRRDVDIAGRGRRARHASTATPSRSSPSASVPRRPSTSTRKTPRLRDRYGRDTWGQCCLLARRLVEAGVTFVTVNTGRLGHARQQLPRAQERACCRATTGPWRRLVERPARPRPGQATCW